MATFVLVHGSWLGGWMWDGVAAELAEAGHEVIAPTLDGAGRLTDHVRHVRDVVAPLEQPVIVAHSYAGMVATGVVTADPAAVRAVVYLDAFVPDGGQSAFDVLPDLRAPFEDGAREAHSDAAPPLPVAMFGIDDPAVAAGIESRMRPWPLATHREPSPGLPDSVPVAYVQLAAGRFFDDMADRLEVAGWPVERLDLHHLAPITDPVAIAAALQRGAESARKEMTS